MSDGLRVGLIFGGVAVVGYLIWKRNAAAALPTGTSPTSSASTLASPPGAPRTAASIGTALVSGTASTLGRAASGIYNFNKGVVVGFYNVDKKIVSGIGSAVSSIGHDIASIF